MFLNEFELHGKLHRIIKYHPQSGWYLIGKKYAKNKNKFYQDANFYSVDEIQKELASVGFHHFELRRAVLPEDIKVGQGKAHFLFCEHRNLFMRKCIILKSRAMYFVLATTFTY